MEASKLEHSEEDIPDFEALEKEPGLGWVINARRYYDQGDLNLYSFREYVQVVRWFRQFDKKPVYNVSKRLFDFFAASILILLFSPVLLVTAVLIKIDSPGPIFYRQVRIGQFRKPFNIVKFRTMRTDAERMILFVGNEVQGGMFKSQADTRITRVGRFLRSWSVDELPQLWNVVKGEMSLVGPRPLPVCDTSTVDPEFGIRFAAIPGITGLWQVNMRGSTNGTEKLRQDCEYVLRRSWATDARILLKTIPTVLGRKGAY